MSPEPTVFVVDDDASIRRSLRRLIESVGLAVEDYAAAEEFLQRYDPARPGCLVLDVRMPGASGLDLQETLAARRITLPIIFVTGHGDVPMTAQAMKAGAVDFIQKPFDEQVLLTRIREALELDGRMRREQAERVDIAARLARLTPREREVMALLVAGKSAKQIAFALGLSRKTVDVHRGHVMTKMRVDSLVELARLARCLGDVERQPDA